MKTVRLPIFEDGFRNGETLEVNIEYFTTGPGRHFGKIINDRNPAVEKEIVDRIISGLPPRRFEADADTQELFPEAGSLWDFLKDPPRPSAHFTLEKDGTVTQNVKPEEIRHGRLESISFVSEEEGIGEVTLVDVVSKHPDPESWRTIPGWEHYGMMPDRTIVDKETKQEVPLVDKGRQTKRNASVLLYHNDGGLSHMNVAWLFRQTYPELND